MSVAKTAFDLDFERNMQDPEFRAAYRRAQKQIAAIDQVMRALDAARVGQGISKAELARRMGVSADAIRRLFSTKSPNPTIGTVVSAAEALGLRVTVASDRKPRPGAPKRKRAAA